MELVQQLLAQIQQFQEYPHSQSILLVVSGILSLVGFIQIIRKGAALVFWMALFVVGIVPLTYAYKGSEIDFLAHASNSVGDLGNLVPGIRDDVVKVVCDKLDQAGQL